jgi:tellurium resistance protein TerD
MSDITILPKGASISIKEKAPDLKKAVVGAGWDVNEGLSMDLDLTAVTVKADGKAKDVVYYGNKDAAGLHHTGDNLTGEGEGDDEQIVVTLADLSSEVNEVVFLVNIYEATQKSQNFGQVKNSHVRVLNADGDKELARHDLAAEYATNTGVLVAKFVRDGDSWKFQAVGEGVNGSIDEILSAKGYK